ncbi:MAG: sulfate/molybdate ABC transporter ATP-binding protein [Syntrophomonadaceae bacterium]
MELMLDIKKKLPGFTLQVKFAAGDDVTGLLGASGAGKSMTLRCIAGLEKPDEGKIILNGQVLFDSSQGINLPARKRKVGFLFQNYALFPNMTVEENITFALDGKNQIEKRETARRMLEMIKLEGFEKRYPYQLSGGQQQRVALARALASGPRVLLLDEPFSALDEHLRSQMVKQLLEVLSGYQGITLFVTHNIEEIYRMAGQMVVIVDGRIEACGVKEEVFQNPTTVAAARLTGCKNFTEAKVLSPDQVQALDWDVKLKVRPVGEDGVSHIGIRAHYLSRAGEESRENVFNCWPSFVNDTPFRNTVYLTLKRKPSGPGDYHLQWEMPRDRWLELKDQPLPWKICLDPDRIMTLKP